MSSGRAELPAVDLGQQLKEVVDRIAQVMDAERCTLFLYDAQRDELWSKVFTESKIGEIRVRSGEGIAGHVMATGETVRVDDAAHDPRFAARFDRASGFVTRSVLCAPLENVHDQRIGVVQVLNKRGGPFSAADTALLAALSSQAAIAIENARLYQDLRAARDAESELARRLAVQHGELQHAYRRQEETKEQLEQALRRAQRLRVAASAGSIGLFVVLGLASWRLGAGRAPLPGAAARLGRREPVAVTAQPLEVVLPLAGRLEPLAMTTVTSPLAGTVRHVWFRPGERVGRGQRLLELDTTLLEVELRSARASLIKAEQRARGLSEWSGGPEAAEGRRKVSKARLSLEASRRALDETKALFDKGIVGRAEYEAAQRQHASEELDFTSVEQELAAVLDEGSAENLRVAEMELENARVNLERLESRMAQALVTAPTAGVAIRPAGGGELAEGGRVEVGQALVAIGDLTSLAAVAAADELEVERLRLGQRARVRSDAFPGVVFDGVVRSVAAGGAGAASGYFVTVAVASLPAEIERSFRLGLSARVEAVVYERSDALLVPIAAVEAGEAGQGWVEVAGAASDKPERRRVVLGETTVTAVEIREGLAAGERVLVPRR
jgi:multidrug efflux pump subunit AcrA (membrane-fusion protein)/putative methionine-R-sulfoxide reductase with GAF domain